MTGLRGGEEMERENGRKEDRPSVTSSHDLLPPPSRTTVELWVREYGQDHDHDHHYHQHRYNYLRQ
ncbi:hypothetical protein E2C01_013785 [Portunus trituberculatus]|uniref:Uncharacterized protein n=1 Tax=Portunus trituberculatus TaxID=210409 RepID=A0A5B7DHZ9_PORTR|nr:hypothetical protein [Portunus trituberculatus]